MLCKNSEKGNYLVGHFSFGNVVSTFSRGCFGGKSLIILEIKQF